MNMTEVRTKAKELGIKASRKKKAELIREIQRTESNLPCFETNREDCDEMDCCFRGDCMKNAC